MKLTPLSWIMRRNVRKECPRDIPKKGASKQNKQSQIKNK